MSTPDPRAYRLTEADSRQIFDTSIAPQLLSGADQRARPVLVIIGSQTGAGKSALTIGIMGLFGRRGGAAHINMDFFIARHPYADRLRSEYPAAADKCLRPDGDRWWAAAQDYVIRQRVNALVESAMLSRAEFEDIVARFAAAGYRVEVALMAVAPALSRLGILSRYRQELMDSGRGRLVAPDIHNHCVQGVARGAKAIDQGAPVTVQLFRRGNVRVYANRSDANSAWYVQPPAAAGQLHAERRRKLAPAEAASFTDEFQELASELGGEFQAQLQQIKSLARGIL